MKHKSLHWVVWLFGFVLLVFIGWVMRITASNAGDSLKIVVYKRPSCGCCNEWVDYLRMRGFKVETHNRDDMRRVKTQFGVPDDLHSCHTAKIGHLVVEGHVTAPTIKKAINDQSIKVIAVPGMPFGSPGMGEWVQPFEEVAMTTSGKLSVYNRVTGPDQL